MITIYSKPQCVQCEGVKKALDRKGIAYQVRDVTQDADAMQRVVGLGYRQMPVIETDSGDSWSGYRMDKMLSLE